MIYVTIRRMCGCFAILIVVSMLGCKKKPDYQLAVDENAFLSEDLAMACSKEALRAHGLNMSRIFPVKHRDVKEGFFVRNTKSPDNGYTLWHEEGRNTLYEYIVDVDRIEGILSCNVSAAK